MKSRASWYILNLAVSSGFFPSFYLLLYVSLYHFRQFKQLKDFLELYALNETKRTGTAERKHFYRLSKSLHC